MHYYPNLFCYKTLHVSGIFFAHHQGFSTVRSAVVSFMLVLMTVSKHLSKVCKARVRIERSSNLTLLGSGHQNQHETYQCRTYSGKLLMMGKEDARNM